MISFMVTLVLIRFLGGIGADLLYGEAGGDVIYGEAGIDVIYGGAGGDTVLAGADNDTVLGGDDNDVLYGETGADALYGEAGIDVLYGGDDGDFLYGGLDNDFIYGDGGNDYIDGGSGSDSLYGGLGQDTFAFNGADVASQDIVYDFSVTSDYIRIATVSAISSFADVLANATDYGTFSVIDLDGGNSIRLEGVLTTQYTAGMFLIFPASSGQAPLQKVGARSPEPLEVLDVMAGLNDDDAQTDLGVMLSEASADSGFAEMEGDAFITLTDFADGTIDFA